MLKVLIVDDMDIIRREFRRLKLWGEETGFIIWDEAKNGYEALIKLKINPVDLVITDIKMPKIDGLELLQNIIHKNYCSCVVLMSDYSDFRYVRQGLVLGAFDYMVKPVEEMELNKILQRAKEIILDKKKQQERLIYIEQKLSEEADVYFTETDVEQIIEFICEENPNIFRIISDMINRIGINLRNDLIKLESVLKKVLAEIGGKILDAYEWFDNFFNINSLTNINFSKCNDFEAMKALFLSIIEKYTLVIKKLKCGKCESIIVTEVCKCVLKNIEGDVSLKFVADKLFMNKTYISQTFKEKTGVSFVEYLTTIRMERAIKLIAEVNLKVYEIGDKLGFKDVEYFSKLFKRYTGLTPTEFRLNIK